MLSKSQIKVITRLKQKKYRVQDGFFVAEGLKVIKELLDSNLELHQLYTTLSFDGNLDREQRITEAELKKISFLTTPNKALALFKIPASKTIDSDQFVVALDSVRDPGNLGTIIRLCDWFGVKELICTTGTVDCYNPKVIQATMGSITRVNVSYLDLERYLKETRSPVFGAFMDGDIVYKTDLPTIGTLVLGNEANGISPEIEGLVTNRITIPRFGALQAAESLNVATATAILLSEFKRKG
ncbi:RNA methyltransferase [Bizionia gelidisalsuginis]|uniref:RNA methyltransferase n=1 Tax=Bizionia gelidisalsuginis TaxID=291188 RepID=A0ABY3MA63_9FLAO|nr:RNA methyltransferase [Bizionia gelidisalsuginis]TYC12640.1 RNA methyltransferase [Bizionia gelidisalsuginis]